ncbi:uncharacterized protein PG986_001554 [Apiospora aurea]|uniref:Uncharacterized protein n=1 Tax=Apiospora aurea TaxID=335848 RepID=A0ABR1QXT7_9PEZI
MAPVQQTFSVIPELPSAFANGSDTATARSSKPPMTTKQAKKLYKAATKLPKLSKAEQRKQDLMEQDRIRREFEKERNQARAKTARDKKKEKEEKEKADKKRKGLPLKEVHPSQDTLARFMRPLKPAKKVEEDPKPPPPPSPPSLPQTGPDNESDETLSADDGASRPTKRQKLDESVEQAIDATTCDQSPSRSPEVNAQEETAPEIPTMEAERESPLASPSVCAAGDTKIENQTGKRHANESFSADDGLDDDDFSALFVDVTLDPEPGLAKAPDSQQSHLFSRPPDPIEPPEPARRSEECVNPPADAMEAIISRTSIASSSQHPKDVSSPEAHKADRNTRDTHPTGLAKVTSDLGNKNSTSQNTSRSPTLSCPTLTTDTKATNLEPHTNAQLARHPLASSSEYSNPQSRFIHPRVAPRSSANGASPDEQRSSSSNPFRFKAPTHNTQRPSQGFQNAKTAPAVESTGAAQSHSREPPRPSPKPFFTSSGTRELTFLAIERSKRSAREDLHARRKEDRDLAKQDKSKRLKETTQKEPKVRGGGKPPRSDDEIDDDNDYELDEILLASDLIKEPVPDRKAEPHAINTAKCEVSQTRVHCPNKPVGAMSALNRPRSPDEKKQESAADNKPKGSYEKMLELAARQRDAHDQKGKQIESMSEESDKENREQDIPIASQGTDYGDAAWDMTDLDLDSFL